MGVRAYKFRLYPSRKQATELGRHLWLSKNLWNDSLKYCKAFYNDFGRFPSKGTFESLSKGSGLYSQVGQKVAWRLSDALKRFCVLRKKGVRVGFPRFKPMDRMKSLQYPQFGFELKDKLTVTPFGAITLRKHREVKGRIKTLVLKREASGKWYAILTAIAESVAASPNNGGAVGIDLGLTRFATLSNGVVVKNPRHFRKREGRLAFLQRELSKKAKGGRNRRKAKRRVAVAFEKLTNARKDFLHKLSARLVDEYSLIALEKLNVQEMAGKGFGKSINDASWSAFAGMVGYKAESAGCRIVLVDPRNTTKECSGCGALSEKELSDRVHCCPRCGLVLDRDLNAAINILARATVGTTGSNACRDEAMVSSVMQDAAGFSPS